MPTFRGSRLIYTFLLGLLFPVLGTLAACACRGQFGLGAVLFVQAHSPLLRVADVAPFALALFAFCCPGLRPHAQALRSHRALIALMLALTALPMLLLLYARREEARAEVQFADVNTSGSLRFRSLWLQGAGQPEAHVSLAARTAQRDRMRAILDAVRGRYPADVAATDKTWARFNANFQAHGRVGWQNAQAMRDAADGLTRHIERHALAQAQQASRLLFGGIFGLALSGLGSLVLLQRLRRSEEVQEHMSAILDTTTDLVGMADAQGQVVYLNTAFRRFFCLPLNAPLPRYGMLDKHAPWSRAKMAAEARPTALAEGSWEGETALLHPTRGEVPMSQLLLAHRAPNGSLEAWFTTARDITERKAVETALLEAEALFRSAISAMQEGFLVQDSQGKVLMANKWAEEIMGLSPDEMVGQVIMRGHWRTIHEDGTPFARAEYPSRRALRTGLPQAARVLGLDKPGQPLLWLSVSAAPLFHAGETVPYAAVSTFSDITAQKAAADALRQAQEDLLTVVGNAPMILFSLDADGLFTTSEGKGLELLGLRPGQVVGQSLFEYVGDNPVVCSQVRRALAGETVSYVAEVAGHVWENQLRPLLGAGAQEGIIGISFDVTDRQHAEDALHRGEERLRRLYEVTADAELPFEEKIDRLLQMGCAQFGLETGLLAKLDETVFEVVQSYAPGGPNYQGLTCDPQHTFCRQATLSGEPLGIEDVGGSAWASHPAYQAWKPEAYLGTQVIIGGRPFGTLCFVGSRPHPAPFTTGDKDLLRLMAQWVGGEMQRRETEQKMHDYNIVLEFQAQEMERANRELERANAQLATLAATDSLTGLCNRRALSERLTVEIVRARRYDSPMSVLLMDVDEFKQYNDTFGHLAGDIVLQTVGAFLNAHARVTDLAARYGGEEFAVVLPQTNASGALVVAERIRRALQNHAWPLRAVTMSIGICTLSAGTADADALLAAADKALYRSKAAGRNRVTHAADPQVLPVSRPADFAV